jgi:hypothetical protein
MTGHECWMAGASALIERGKELGVEYQFKQLVTDFECERRRVLSLRTEKGGVFGISHDVGQQGTNRPMVRMRLKNLFFTGHSITMPGICGTFINAFDSCEAIRDDDALFDQAAT